MHLVVATLIALVDADQPASQPTSSQSAAVPSARPKDHLLAPAIGVDEYNALPYGGAAASRFRLFVHGFLRARASATAQDAAAPFVGRNNGFNLVQARLELTAGYGNNLWIRMSMDSAFDRGNDLPGAVAQTGVGQLVFGLRDAYIAYQPLPALRFMIGQFRAPFDEEALTSTARLMFISRALNSQGVRATEGYFVPGMSPDREIGIRISGEELHLSKSVTANYYVAVTNGNGINANANDNNLVAVWARGELNVPYVRFGAAGFWNPTTSGSYPNLFDEMKYGGTGDIRFVHNTKFGELVIFGQYAVVQTRYTATGAPTITQMGAHAQMAYKFFFGLQPAYRLAWLDANDKIINDLLLYHTFGLSYDLPWAPLRVKANYTLTGEQSGRALTNNIFEFLVQAVF